jgi:Zn-dependent protease
MPTSRQGSIRLFGFSGIQVFLHWSWFLVAAYEIQSRKGTYSSVSWNVLEYVALFLIVLLHEFGHALACRQVGGQANQIVLWPLGGVAYVDPPPRPGATLWSIAAGPLVNVALFPLLLALVWLSRSLGWAETIPNLPLLLHAILMIDAGLLIFNILPIYPLDGGQILRALLWFVFGRGRSLMIAAILGLIGVAGFIILAFWMQSIWYGAIAAFMLMNCWSGLKHAQALLRIDKLPRRDGFACPACKTQPPVGDLWKCGRCGQPFDTFQTRAVCPNCAAQFAVTKCSDCGAVHPISEWVTPVTSISSSFPTPSSAN